jgi:hypothetical protein
VHRDEVAKGHAPNLERLGACRYLGQGDFG